MKKIKSFTLIELLVVIGIIGILATIVIPAVGNALADAKRTSAQAGCKSYEDSIFQADTKFDNRVKISARAKKDDAVSNAVVYQKGLYRVLAGNVLWDSKGNHEDLDGSTSEGVWGEFEISCDDGQYYEALIDPGFFETNDDGDVERDPSGEVAPTALTKFGTRYQLAYREAEDNGTINIYHPITLSSLKIHGVKRFAHPVRVVTFDDEEPAKLITRDGSFRLFSDEKCSQPINGTDWEGTTEVYIDNK
jgi:prepilin-type N-terminal cleavage/methylation domain-containing protein